jgi:hypothetical protein
VSFEEMTDSFIQMTIEGLKTAQQGAVK